MTLKSEPTEGLKQISPIELVPKLKGKVNYADWESKLFMALGVINKGDVELLCNDTVPRPPSYKKSNLPTVNEVLRLQDELNLSIDAAIDYKNQEIETENAALKTKYEIAKRKWDTANTSVYLLINHTLDPIPALQIKDETSAYGAFQILRAQYA